MLSKNQFKLIAGLKQKKQRTANQLFVAEGKKVILELLNSDFQLHQLYTTTSEYKVSDDMSTRITPKELKRISFLKTPQAALAIFKIPEPKPIELNGLIVALDNVRDPGNLGTIIRLCDWFGIRDLVCSSETADCYNPKVVQASMGSLARVNVTYSDLEVLLKYSGLSSLGTFMDGSNIFTTDLPQKGIIVFGNEAHGISEPLENLVQQKIGIPRFGSIQLTESLNVANAMAIVMAEFKRRTIEK
ncbi:MAG: RNA methyltransferase [Flavobacteriaceae bacterium]|nr:RNA methyltransferase [Flavobacteriaceae bacterium]